ncbi:MAG: Ig-like domain-containing protein [Myxococcota bacterium]
MSSLLAIFHLFLGLAEAQPAPELSVIDVQLLGFDTEGIAFEVSVRNEGVTRTGPVQVQLDGLVAVDPDLQGPHEAAVRVSADLDLWVREVATLSYLAKPPFSHDPACFAYFGVRLLHDAETDTELDNNVATTPLQDCPSVVPPSVDPDLDPELPSAFPVERTFWASDLGIPGKLGGMLFSQDRRRLFVVAGSDTLDSSVYSLAVERDAAGRIRWLEDPVLEFSSIDDEAVSGPVGISAGLERGVAGRLLYPSWPENELRERPNDPTAGYAPSDRIVLRVDDAVSGLAQSPVLEDWVVSTLQDPKLHLLLESRVLRFRASTFAELPTPAGGLAFVPVGEWAGHLLYTDWSAGAIHRLAIDPDTGHPIDASTERPLLGTSKPFIAPFATGLGRGPWGIEFDPVSHDLLVSTWTHGADDRILLIDGSRFGRSGPVVQDVEVSTSANRAVDIFLDATDADSTFLRYEVDAQPEFGRLEGEPPNLVYVPLTDVPWVARETFSYTVSDGTYTSRRATIAIAVIPGPACGCATPLSSPWNWGLGLLVLLVVRRWRQHG